MNTSLFLAFVCLWIDTGTTPTAQTGILVTSRKSLLMPLAIKSREGLLRIRLFVSNDRGENWRLAMELGAEEERAIFHAPTDGEYWFSLQLIYQNRATPPESEEKKPALKVRIEKTPQNAVTSSQYNTSATRQIERLEEFVSCYHARPDASQVLWFLDIAISKEVQAHFLFRQRLTSDILAHSFGHMSRRNKSLIRGIEARFAAASPTSRRLLLEALAVCGDQTTIRQLRVWASSENYKSLSKEIQFTAERLAHTARRLPRHSSSTTVQDLDLLWADFLVTGDYAPVKRILDALNEKNKKVLRECAAWSLRANAEQHSKLREVLRSHLRQMPPRTQAFVRPMLQSIEHKQTRAERRKVPLSKRGR